SVQNLSVDDGTLTDNGDGTWSFTPDENFNGEVNLSYDVSDGTTTTAATGTIEVAEVNDAADVSAPTSFSMNEDGTITISEDSLLANASDVDGDTLSVQNFSADGGTLTDNGDGTWTFEPADDFSGDINLSYDVSDGTDTVATTGTVSVEGVADAPTLSINVGAPSSVTVNVGEAQSNTLFTSNFESVDASFQNSVEGWNTESDAIEVRNGSEDNSDSGNNYIELNEDTGNHYDDAESVNRVIDTEDGATYTFDFNYSGRPGYDEQVNAIEVRVNGETVAEFHHDNSNNSHNDWQDASFSFSGTGEPMKVEFVSIGDGANGGRGMFIDNIQAVEDIPAPTATYLEYPVDVEVALSDTDRSETLSDITLSDIPDGATLLVNGQEVTVTDGSATISPENLGDVSIRVPEGTENFNLSASVTSSEMDGDTATTTTTAPTISMSVGEATSEEVPGDATHDVSITSDNYNASDSGFTVSGRTIVNGELTEASTNNVTVSGGNAPEGFGVKGATHGAADGEIGYDNGSEQSEELIIDFDQDVSSVDVSFAYLNPHESASYELFQDGVKVGEGQIDGGSDGVEDAITFTADGGVDFDQIVFSAPSEGDDYLIHSVDFEASDTETFVELPLTLNVSTDGSESLSGVTLSGVPDNAIILVNGEQVTVTDGSVTIAPENLGDVSIRVPEGSEDFNLSASVTASDENGNTATSTSNLEIPVSDSPDNSDGNNTYMTDAENEGVNNDGYRTFDEAKDDMGGNGAFSHNQGDHGNDHQHGNHHAWRTGGKELYEGNEGDDIVGNQWNNYGDDLMAGGADDDVVYGGSGDDVMYGDNGDNLDATTDTNSNNGNDTLDGGSGDDEIYGEGGDDHLDGGSGNDFLVGGSGDDELVGDSGHDTLHGGSGNDNLDGGWGNDKLEGGSGADTLDGGGGDDVLTGGSGDDVLKGGDNWGDDTLDGGEGNDTLYGGNGAEGLNGGEGDETL
ncbi:MAG: tandem-95 repeat protein, partial [Methylocystaceae bacterium]|nr:tandem-95 repeat protein [Methylocystaceae bacterium]